MNTQLTRSFAARGLLAAALAAGALGAHAASGFTIDQAKESQIQVGMSQDAVRQALGRPELNVKYMDEPGRTWSYEVVGALQPAVFDVDFGADGTVLSVSERVQPDIN